MIDIIGLLSKDGYIVCNKTLLKMYGAECAILIGELCAEYKYFENRNELDENGYFFSTQANIEENTGLNEYAQRKAFKLLQDEGLIVITKKGLPAKNYYKIVEDKLFNIFTASPLKFKGLEVQNLNINNNKQKIIKNNTVAPTSETFNFGMPTVQKRKSSNDVELDNAFVLVDDYTNNKELNKKLKELFSNRKEQCGNNRQHFYASTCKHYLDELSKVKDQLGAVNLSLQYNNTFKVMEPNVYPNQKQWHPDTNISTQTKSCDNDIALDDKGNPITF